MKKLSLLILLCVSAVMLHAQNIIVGDDGTILLSSDGGSTWVVDSASGVGTSALKTIAVYDADTIYLGGDAGVYKTTDSALTYTQVSTIKTLGMGFYNSGKHIRGVGRSSRNAFLYSNDYGATWSSQDESRRDADGTSFSIGGTNMFAVQPARNEAVRSVFNTGDYCSSTTTIYQLADYRYNGVLNNDSIIIVLSEQGVCWQSVDSGVTFTQLALPSHTGTPLNEVKTSPDQKSITIVGDGGYIANSQDGGKTWSKVSTTNGTMSSEFRAILDIFYINDTLVWIGGGDGDQNTDGPSLAKSIDGGATFRQVDHDSIMSFANDSRWRFEAINFVNDSVGYVGWSRGSSATDYQIYRTMNGGLNWQRINKYTNTDESDKPDMDGIQQIIVRDYDNFVMTSSRSGGKIWNTQVYGDSARCTRLYATTGTMNDVYFTSPNDAGYACTSTGLIYEISNNGLTWTKLTTDLPVQSYAGISKNYVVGANNSVFVTSDYLAWTEKIINPANYNKPRVIFAVDNNNVYLVGDGGMILKSTNAGTVFVPQTTINDIVADLKDVYFIDVNTGWVVGDTGFIAFTNDAGSTWTQQNTPTNDILNAVYAYDANNVVVVGDNGVMLKTDNGGTTWSLIASGVDVTLRDVVYMNNTNAVAIPEIAVAAPATKIYCAGEVIDDVAYTVTGAFDASNVFALQLSGPTGTWADAVTLATQAGTSSGIFSGIVIPDTTAMSANYQLRVVGSMPAVYGEVADLITVNPVPSVDLGVDKAICAGAPLTLDAGAGATAYAWNTSATDQTIVVTTAGDYSIIVSNAYGCSAFDTVTVSENTLPVVATIANTTIGSCETIQLATDVTGNAPYVYAWTGAGLDTATIEDPTVITPVVGVLTTYSLVVTDMYGCSNTTSVDITVTAAPTVTIAAATANICVSDSTYQIVADTSAGIVSMAWDNGADLDNAAAKDPVVANPKLGTTTYTVTVTDGDGCTATDAIAVTVDTMTTAGFSWAVNSYTVIDFTNSSTDAVTYSWDFGDGTGTSTATNPQYDYTVAGIWTVTLTAVNGQCSDTAQKVVSTTVSVDGISADLKVIYPNPTQGSVTIEGVSAGDVVEVIAEGGQVVASTKAASSSVVINLAGNAKGVYVVRITNGSAVETATIVVE